MNTNFKTTVLLFFFSFLLQDYCYSQSDDGRFFISGQAQANTGLVNGAKYPYGLLEAELGYVVVDRLMGMATLSLASFENRTYSKQTIEGRYSFVRIMPIEIYGGLNFGRSEEKYDGSNFLNGEFVSIRVSEVTTQMKVLFGSYYFLSENLVLDAQLGLPVLTKIKNFNFFSDPPEHTTNLGGHLALRYFFNGKTDAKVTGRDTSFSKKRMLGLSMKIAEDGTVDYSRFVRNMELAISFGYVLGKKGMIGIRSEIAYDREDRIVRREDHVIRLGLSPFGRFYFLPLQKSKFFVEGQLNLNRLSYKKTKRAKLTSLNAYLGLGWSKKIKENLRLEFFTGIKLFEKYTEDFKFGFTPDYEYGLLLPYGDRLLTSRIGIERYF